MLDFAYLIFDAHQYAEDILCYFDTRVVHEFPYQLFPGGPYRSELNLVALKDEHDFLRKKEIEDLFKKYNSWDRKNAICELVQRESRRMFLEHSSLFRNDREFLLFKDDKIARGNKEMHDFYQRIKRPDPQKGVYTRHYESLSDTDKII